MSFKKEVEVRVTIDGKDYQALSNICEQARIRMWRMRPNPELIGLTKDEYKAMEDFLNNVWD